MSLIDSGRSAALSIVRHRGASVVAVATLAFMLSALAVFILLANGMGTAASNLESKADLIANLNGNVSPSDAAATGLGLERQWPGIHVSYVSKSQALTQFHKTFSNDPAMLSAIQGNPLPASLEIRTKNPRILNRVAAELRSNPEVSHLIFNPNLTHKLIEITTFVRIAGIALVAGLAFLALVIVVNTTHLTVQARKDELEVMKLVGASYAFVRNPLILEGILLGLAGAVLASVVGLGLSLPILKGVLGGGSSNLPLLPIDTGFRFVMTVAGVVLMAGAVVGAAGSYISARRFARF